MAYPSPLPRSLSISSSLFLYSLSLPLFPLSHTLAPCNYRISPLVHYHLFQPLGKQSAPLRFKAKSLTPHNIPPACGKWVASVSIVKADQWLGAQHRSAETGLSFTHDGATHTPAPRCPWRMSSLTPLKSQQNQNLYLASE